MSLFLHRSGLLGFNLGPPPEPDLAGPEYITNVNIANGASNRQNYPVSFEAPGMYLVLWSFWRSSGNISISSITGDGFTAHRAGEEILGNVRLDSGGTQRLEWIPIEVHEATAEDPCVVTFNFANNLFAAQLYGLWRDDRIDPSARYGSHATGASGATPIGTGLEDVPVVTTAFAASVRRFADFFIEPTWGGDFSIEDQSFTRGRYSSTTNQMNIGAAAKSFLPGDIDVSAAWPEGTQSTILSLVAFGRK